MKIKHRIMVFVFMAAIALPSLIYAERASEIVVTGLGIVSINPDSVRINFSIESKMKTAREAADETARKYEQLLLSMQGIGFDANDIITKRYHTEPRWDRPRDKKPKFLGYIARHETYISTIKLEKVEMIIDLILSSGISQIKEVKYFSSKMDSIRCVALSRAVMNAKEEAETMAYAAGGSLGSLIELTTHYPENPTFARERPEGIALKTGIVRSISITPEPITKVVTVLGRWEFFGTERLDNDNN